MKTIENSKKSSSGSKRSKAPPLGLIAFGVIIALFASIIIAGVVNDQHAKAVYEAAHPKLPPFAWSRSDRKRMDAMLTKTFAPVTAKSGLYSIAVLDARGNPIFGDNAGGAVVPASVLKLIVSYAALESFGPEYRFVTTLAAANPVGGNGTIDGNLWLVGSGDPAFRSSDLRFGVDELRRAGLREITGGVSIDASSIRGPEINAHWSESDASEDYQAPTSGVSLDGDTLEHRSPTGERTWTPLSNMPTYVGNTLEQMLRSSGVRVGRGPLQEPAPITAASLWQHRSPPMKDLIAHMLAFSDNHYAEQLLRALGGRNGKVPDDDSGIAAEMSFLRSRNIPTAGIFLVDGSGLADANRVSAFTLARLLADAELRPAAQRLYPLLPRGGKDGTLKRYHFNAAKDRVRAKSGHLAIADSLAGYIDTLHHGRITFVFMINDAPTTPDGTYVKALDDLSAF